MSLTISTSTRPSDLHPEKNEDAFSSARKITRRLPLWWKRFVTIKGHVNLVLSIVVVVGISFFGFRATVLQTAIAVATTIVANSFLLKLFGKPLRWPDSPMVSGLLIALVLAPGTPWFVLVVAGVAGMLSKFLLRFQGKHLFNPAAFGIFASSFLFPSVAHGWWADRIWWLMAVLGLTVILRFRRLHLIGSFLITHVVFLVGFSLITNLGLESLPLRLMSTISPMFLLIMLPEPLTGPATTRGRILYGGLVALLANGLGLLRFSDPLVAGLLAGNLLVPLIRKIR